MRQNALRYLLLPLAICFHVLCVAQEDVAQADTSQTVFVTNRLIGGFTIGLPQSDYKANLDDLFGGIRLAYLKELSYEPWVFAGVELSYWQLSSRTDLTEEEIDGEFVENSYTATTFIVPLQAVLRLYPLSEHRVNPFLEGRFGPKFIGTFTNYRVPDRSVDRSHLGFGYSGALGVSINIVDTYTIEVRGSYDFSTATSYWVDDETLPAVFADPFANFERFNSTMPSVLIDISASMSF